MRFVNNHRLEQGYAWVERNGPHRKPCIILHVQHKELLQALIVRYIDITAFRFPKPLPCVLIPRVKDKRLLAGEFLELTLPVYLQRRRTDNQYRISLRYRYRADSLQCLAQSGLVSEDAPLMLQCVCYSFFLVFVRLQKQTVRNGQLRHVRNGIIGNFF